jgi:hypothetical protein
VGSFKDGVGSSVGDIHTSRDANCSSRTDFYNKRMEFVDQWETPLALRILSVAQRLKLVHKITLIAVIGNLIH